MVGVGHLVVFLIVFIGIVNYVWGIISCFLGCMCVCVCVDGSEPEGQRGSKAPAVAPSRIGSKAPGSSGGVCPRAVTRRGSSGVVLQPSRPRSVCPKGTNTSDGDPVQMSS